MVAHHLNTINLSLKYKTNNYLGYERFIDYFFFSFFFFKQSTFLRNIHSHAHIYKYK